MTLVCSVCVCGGGGEGLVPAWAVGEVSVGHTCVGAHVYMCGCPGVRGHTVTRWGLGLLWPSTSAQGLFRPQRDCIPAAGWAALRHLFLSVPTEA